MKILMIRKEKEKKNPSKYFNKGGDMELSHLMVTMTYNL